MGLPQGERLKRLNVIAIRQMQALTSAPVIKQIKDYPRRLKLDSVGSMSVDRLNQEAMDVLRDVPRYLGYVQQFMEGRKS